MIGELIGNLCALAVAFTIIYTIWDLAAIPGLYDDDNWEKGNEGSNLRCGKQYVISFLLS